MVESVQIDTTSNVQAEQEVPDNNAFAGLARTRSVQDDMEGIDSLVPLIVKLQQAYAMIKVNNNIELP